MIDKIELNQPGQSKKKLRKQNKPNHKVLISFEDEPMKNHQQNFNLLYLLLFISFSSLWANSWDKDYISNLSTADCRGITTKSEYSCRTNDCKGIASGDRYKCDSDDCRAVVSRDKYMCKSNLCKAWISGNPYGCDSDDCRGVASRDKNLCESKQCKAIASGNSSWCS